MVTELGDRRRILTIESGFCLEADIPLADSPPTFPANHCPKARLPQSKGQVFCVVSSTSLTVRWT